MVRVGILGAGSFAQKHLLALDALKVRAQVAAVGRRTGSPWPEAESRGVPLVTPEALVSDAAIDAIAVCVPNGLHRHCVEMALRAGKHVLCEKPLALTLDDVDNLLDTADETKRVLMAAHLTRHTAPYAAVADLLQSGRLGPVHALHSTRLQVRSAQAWRMHPNLGGGALFDLLIHDFDLLGWYLGEATRVTAAGHRHVQGALDYASAVFSYADGAIATVEGGFILPPTDKFQARLRIHCAGGKIEVDGGDVRLFEEHGRSEAVPLAAYADSHKGLVSEYEEFLDAIEGTAPRRLHLDDARRAVECAVAADSSARWGNTVKLG